MTSGNSIAHIINGCRDNDRESQKALYDLYSPVLYAIALRYIKDQQRAEDIMVKSMYVIMKKIKDFKGDGSFEGWMKKITVNECLMYLRKKVNKIHHQEVEERHVVIDQNAIDQLQHEDILRLIRKLPDGYRTVFNLYVIEGFKHKEIAEKLNITESTSKSQLFLAKKKLKDWIQKIH